MVTESRLLLLSSQPGTRTSFFYGSHAYVWAAWVLILFAPGPWALAYCPEVVLLSVCAVCFTKCWALPLHVYCTTVFAVFYSVLLFYLVAIVCQLSSLARYFVYVQIFHFLWSNTFLCVSFFGPTLVPTHCLFPMHSFEPLILL